eukprot:scaffold540475_cov17-Prasinocladus_malaysianus.AAC.1
MALVLYSYPVLVALLRIATVIRTQTVLINSCRQIYGTVRYDNRTSARRKALRSKVTNTGI